jgi:hypothetical protein
MLGVLGATTPGGLNQLSFLGIDVGGGGCVAGDIPWVSTDPTSGTTAGGSATPVEVTFDATGLSFGVYEGTLCVQSDDPDEPEVLVALTLTVQEEVLDPDIDVSPTAITETLEVGQTATNPVTIDNLGDADLDWSVVEAADDTCVAGDLTWASADPTSGTTAAGASSTVDVTFDATGLAAGTYEGALCVNSNDPDEPQVPVALDAGGDGNAGQLRPVPAGGHQRGRGGPGGRTGGDSAVAAGRRVPGPVHAPPQVT